MRTVVLLSAMILAGALNPEAGPTPKIILNFMTIILVITAVMDILEWLVLLKH